MPTPITDRERITILEDLRREEEQTIKDLRGRETSGAMWRTGQARRRIEALEAAIRLLCEADRQ